jgi:hypothetical protein
MASNTLDNALLTALIPAWGGGQLIRSRDAHRTDLARYTAPSSAALCSSLPMVYKERRPSRTASALSNRAIGNLSSATVCHVSLSQPIVGLRLGVGVWHAWRGSSVKHWGARDEEVGRQRVSTGDPLDVKEDSSQRVRVNANRPLGQRV